MIFLYFVLHIYCQESQSLDNGDKRSLSFICMRPPSLFSSFHSLQQFLPIFQVCLPLFLSLPVSHISTFLTCNVFAHSLMLLLHPCNSHFFLLWGFFLLSVFLPPPLSCCCECHILKCVYIQKILHLLGINIACLISQPVSLLSCIILLVTLSASHFQNSPLSLTSLFFIQVQLVLNGLSWDLWQQALWYLRQWSVLCHGGCTRGGSAEGALQVSTKRSQRLVSRMKAGNSHVCAGQPMSVWSKTDMQRTGAGQYSLLHLSSVIVLA